MREEYDDVLVGSREVFAYGEIDNEFAKRLTRDICHLRSLKKEPLTIYLSSPGGDVGFGLGLYDFIQALDIHVTLVGLGEVASAATILLQAADRRILTVNSVMMLHGLSIGTEDTLHNVETFLKASKISQEQMLNIYSKKSSMTIPQLRNKLQKDWYMTSDTALDLGFIDERI